MPTSNQSEVVLVAMDTKDTIMTLKPKTDQDKGYGMCMGLKIVQDDNSPNYILTTYEDGSIGLWDLKTGSEVSHVTLHSEPVMSFDYHSGLNKGISTSVDNNIIAWNINQKKEVVKLKDILVPNDGFNCVKIRPDGKLFVTGGWDAQGRIFGLKQCSPLAVLSYHRESVQAIDFSYENLIALGSKDGIISLWNQYS